MHIRQQGQLSLHVNGHYQYHDIYHHTPNDDDNGKGRTDVISDDDKESIGNNNKPYENCIPGHHRDVSKNGSNTPTVVSDHSEDHDLACHGSSNHGGLDIPSHDDPPPHPNLHQKWH